MTIEKSHWSSNGNVINLAVPFTKVNREKRTVSGFATLDNLDQTGDVVTMEASMKAFENFRGNLREMHQPTAVGKVVSFRPETYYDPKSKQFYNGVYVDAYISKGAQDTWEKVLDGTLQGFSIGGKILDSDNEVNKATGQSVRFIKDYALVELSIVDSPANELCNILSIEKVNGQMIFKGIAADVKMQNIFYCADSDSVFMSTESEYVSPVTGKKTELIGWVESNDVNKSKEIDKILDSYKSRLKTLPDTQIAKQANAEGGNEVENVEVTNTEETVEKLRAPEAAPAAEEVAVVETPSVEKVEESTDNNTSAEVLEQAADVSDAQDSEPDFAKMLGDLKGFFSETLEKASEANAAQVSAIKDTVETFSKGVDARISELAEKHTALSDAVNAIKNTIDGVEKRVDAVESETAIKKSLDLGGSREVTIKKSKWNGTFLGSVSELIK
jgi:flagellar basal body rod protein FlgC